MSRIKIDQLWVPDTLDGEDTADFLASVEGSRQVQIHIWGTDDLAASAAETLQNFRDPYEWYVVLIARLDGGIVGQAGIVLPLADSTHLAYVTLEILPSAQGHGVGRELLEAAEQFVRGENRRVVVVETHHPVSALALAEDERLKPAQGAGSLPLSSREVAFAQRADYHLQHIEHFSACPVPLPGTLQDGLMAEAAAAQHGNFTLHQWLDRCPDKWLRDIAALEGDPGNDPDWPAEDLEAGGRTAGGIRDAEALVLARGRRTLVTAVEDTASGTLVGFTSTTMLSTLGEVDFQDDTVVANEYDGQLLGQLIMVANMELLSVQFPKARRVYTWTAVDDGGCTDVNGKLGFVPAGVSGQWRKDLGSLR
ncbi:GNAT family N-acetyltransferase [Paenarthrobacter sp. Z7-10]|uniref:GNAT family N-acetyltransferase n=1 Tax=Paenarthrobacter sp. Z7-10 TaxID=2787635 RepID=UPI0022A9A070|nr:GNAT family N-acetyltransferase [Paenarthrobacter sp. Z7-10]MCZ2402111.1 GNAT family N-acetyltransferase [Paenarthrobacter sp. Z7-10]